MGKFKRLSEIYLTFLKLGSVSFGGGYAIISLMEREIVEEKKWVDREKICDIFAVAQSLPGAIALNASAFAGYSIAGVWGAVSALLGSLTPSVAIMVVLSMLLVKFSGNQIVQSAFSGIRPVIVALIIYAAYKIGKIVFKDVYSVIISIIAFALTLFINIPVIYVILGGIAAGFAIYIIRLLAKVPVDEKTSGGGK